MHIEHVAIWTSNLERLKCFYEEYFDATAGPQYVNTNRGFASYFISFASGARLELMTVTGLAGDWVKGDPPGTGYAHLAIALGSSEKVDALTAELRAAGYIVAGEPRWTGDGYYESVILDPDGNQIELTI